MTNAAFWQGKRVLVTGHTGFKGAWMTMLLHRLGAQVSGLSLAPHTTPSMFEALKISEICTHEICDIRDRAHVAASIKKIAPEIVFHMAAQPLVRESYRDPLSTYETNVIGTGNVLMALADVSSVRSIVVVTTDKCYENREWQWGYRETDALGGFDPYSSSKACTEILAASFRRSFFDTTSATAKRDVGLATARAGNVIGGGDWSSDRLIPDIVRSVTTSGTLEIRYPGAIRPWQHVLVPLSGYLTIAEKLWDHPKQFSEAFNFAPNDDDCVSVETILNEFGKAWGQPVSWKKTGTHEAHEAHFLKLDASKAKSKLAWRPIWNLERTMFETASWYKTFYGNPKNLREHTLQQISALLKNA